MCSCLKVNSPPFSKPTRSSSRYVSCAMPQKRTIFDLGDFEIDALATFRGDISDTDTYDAGREEMMNHLLWKDIAVPINYVVGELGCEIGIGRYSTARLNSEHPI